jgi:hypothetical protein
MCMFTKKFIFMYYKEFVYFRSCFGYGNFLIFRNVIQMYFYIVEIKKNKRET